MKLVLAVWFYVLAVFMSVLIEADPGDCSKLSSTARFTTHVDESIELNFSASTLMPSTMSVFPTHPNLDAGTAGQHFLEHRATRVHERFNTFYKIVCDKCRKRGEQCGCDEGINDGIFRELFQYTTLYEEWAEQQTNMTAMSGVQWLIVDVCCGLGNHLLMGVRGLMFALRLRRAIVFLEESDLHYDMSSVIPIISTSVPAALGWPHSSTKVISTDHRDGHLGIEWMTCGDWFSELHLHDFL